MKKIIYRLKTERTKPYNKKYVSYGVEVLENGELTQYIPEAFTDRKSAKKFVRLCSKLDVAPIHVSDVLEDLSKDVSALV